MFADDTVLVISSSNIKELEKVANDDLNLYYTWLCYNKLSVNVNKTVYMIIKQKNKQKSDINVFLNGEKLKEVQTYKYLGLNLTNDLNWNVHVNAIIKKIVPMVSAIKRCTDCLNKNSRRLLYNSFILPQIRYLIPCWGGLPLYQLNKLQRTQNKAVKSIFQLNYCMSTDLVYEMENIWNLQKIRTYEQIKYIYSIKNKLIKTNINTKQVKNWHEYSTRNANDFRNKYCRTTTAQRSPLYLGIKAYNSVPIIIVEARTMKKLVYNLKMFLK